MTQIYEKCPECGAEKTNDLTCYEKFLLVLSWEATDMELLSLHFWTVASYNLQHPSQFTEAAYNGLKEVYFEAYDHDWPVSYIRKMVSSKIAGKTNVIEKKPRELELKDWSMTISDIWNHDQPQAAANRVLQWRKAVREEL